MKVLPKNFEGASLQKLSRKMKTLKLLVLLQKKILDVIIMISETLYAS
jgi:hypothetical protein